MPSAFLILIIVSCCFGAVNMDSLALKKVRSDSAFITAAKMPRTWIDTNKKKIVVKDKITTDTITTTELYNSGIYGEIHGHDTAHSQTITTGATYVLLTSFVSAGPCRLITCDTVNDKLTILRAGKYRVGLTMSFGGSANSTWRVACFLNNAEQDPIHFARKLGAGGDVGSASSTGIINVTAVPWDLDVRARHDQVGNSDINVWYCNLNVSYLGE